MANMLTRIGFIDETSIKTNMAKTTGWAPCGERLNVEPQQVVHRLTKATDRWL